MGELVLENPYGNVQLNIGGTQNIERGCLGKDIDQRPVVRRSLVLGQIFGV